MKNRILLISLAVVLALSVGLVGCTTPGPEEKDTLIVALSTLQEETFLPWNGGLAREFYMECMYDYLTYLDPVTLKALPGIADSWNMTPDGKTWYFHIRPDVPFHDAAGNTYGNVTADDVKYSIDQVMAPMSKAGPASSMRGEIANVTVIDPQTVAVNMKPGTYDPALDSSYLCQGNAAWIVSKNYTESVGNTTANTNPVATGMYTLYQYQPGYSITLKAVDNYWRGKTPSYTYIRFLKSPDDATRVAMLKAGACDLAPIPYDSVAGVANYTGLKILTVPNDWSPYMVLGGTVPASVNGSRWNPANPWANVTVRQALNYAVNKTSIVKNLFRNQATVAGAQSWVTAWENITDWYPYDPATATSLLTAAGYPGGFNVTVKAYTTTPGAELPLVALAVANDWKAVGVNATVYTVDYTTVVRAEWTTNHALDYIFTHRGMSMSDSVQPINSAFYSGSLFSVYADNDTEAMRALIMASTDRTYRDQLVYQIGLHLKDVAAFVPIAFCSEPYGANSAYVNTWPCLSVTVSNIFLITRP